MSWFKMQWLSAAPEETNASKWVGDFGTLGVMVAALCHDLGHFGRTNVFLVDTGHEWAC